MRIAIVCPYSIDVPGGVQGQAMGSARAFVERGHDVMLMAPGREIRPDLTDLGIRVELLGKTVGVRANGSVAPVAIAPRVLVSVRRYLSGYRPDVVVIHEPFVPLVSLGALLLARTLRIGVFHRGGRSLGTVMLRPLGAVASPRLCGAVVVSEEARAAVRTVVGRRASSYELIANAIDADRFRGAICLSSSRPTVVFLGRHEPRKGLEILLSAVSQISEDFQLWVIGSGPETARLKDHYRDARITWLGRLSDEQVTVHLASADLFVAPSLAGESFGVILLEAMAAMTPVVCSDLPGYRLAAGDAARFVPAGDESKLARAIAELLVDVEARQALVARGAERMGGYTFAGQVDRYLRLFDLSGRSTGENVIP